MYVTYTYEIYQIIYITLRVAGDGELVAHGQQAAGEAARHVGPPLVVHQAQPAQREAAPLVHEQLALARIKICITVICKIFINIYIDR
jgi:hypothetical protein